MPVSSSGYHMSGRVGWTCCSHPATHLWRKLLQEGGRATSGPRGRPGRGWGSHVACSQHPPPRPSSQERAQGLAAWSTLSCVHGKHLPLCPKCPGIPSTEAFHRWALPLSRLRKCGGCIHAGLDFPPCIREGFFL